MLLAASAPPLFEELAILIVAGTLIALVTARLGAVPIIGFLAAGAVIGPGIYRACSISRSRSERSWLG